MTETKLHGGTSTNPFGGEERIDRINLLDYMQPNSPPEKVLFLRVIQDAASNYLYAFLGRNGTSAEEFFSSWQYFFKVTSINKINWNHRRTLKNSYIHHDEKVTKNHYLTDSELRLMCFDQHYDLSGLADYIAIDRFRVGLKEKRRSILSTNWPQVQTYIDILYQRELSQIAEGQQVPLQVWDADLLTVLTDPPTPLHLANAIYVSNKLKRGRKARAKKKLGAGKYSQIIQNLKSNSLPILDNDWGPLSLL